MPALLVYGSDVGNFCHYFTMVGEKRNEYRDTV